MRMTLEEARTQYFGKSERVAVVFVGNKEYVLGLGDTRRCAADVVHCERTLRNLGLTQVRDAAPLLQQHCQALIGYKRGFWSKENPNGVKRDRPRRPNRMRTYVLLGR